MYLHQASYLLQISLCKNQNENQRNKNAMIHEVYQPFTYLFLTSSFNCSVSSRSEFCEGKGEDVFSGLCVELLMSMCALDPRKRRTASQVLQHDWWLTEPRPTNKQDLPRKSGGAQKMGDDLTRRGGELDEGAFKNAARRLDFSGMG